MFGPEKNASRDRTQHGYSIPGLTNVITAAANWDPSVAVLTESRIFSWGAKGHSAWSFAVLDTGRVMT